MNWFLLYSIGQAMVLVPLYVSLWRRARNLATRVAVQRALLEKLLQE